MVHVSRIIIVVCTSTMLLASKMLMGSDHESGKCKFVLLIFTIPFNKGATLINSFRSDQHN